MYLRQWHGVLFICLASLLLGGCYPRNEGQNDEQKNEYFIVGKERLEARDFKGAIEAFEKAVALNPRSALAHFELGVLYEKHGDQKEADFVTAMYHYLQAIKLRPKEYPAENARQRISACKQELVKAEALAPIEQGMMRELNRLKEENQNLRKQLEAAKTPPPNRTGPTGAPIALPLNDSGSITDRFTGTRTAPLSPGGPRFTPLPPVGGSRTHSVKQGETPFSIARQYGIKLNALLSANPALNPKKLRPGQVLTIPSS